MTASRVTRGFHRIGVVLAVPPLLLSAGLAGHEAWQASRAPNPWWTAAPIVSLETALHPVKLVPVEGDPFADLTLSPHAADFTVPLVCLGLSVALYAMARAIGWVLDGFLSPRRS